MEIQVAFQQRTRMAGQDVESPVMVIAVDPARQRHCSDARHSMRTHASEQVGTVAHAGVGHPARLGLPHCKRFAHRFVEVVQSLEVVLVGRVRGVHQALSELEHVIHPEVSDAGQSTSDGRCGASLGAPPKLSMQGNHSGASAATHCLHPQRERAFVHNNAQQRTRTNPFSSTLDIACPNVEYRGTRPRRGDVHDCCSTRRHRYPPAQ